MGGNKKEGNSLLSAASFLDTRTKRNKSERQQASQLTVKGKYRCPEVGQIILVNKKCYHETVGRRGYIHLDTNYVGRVTVVYSNLVEIYRISGDDKRNIRNPQEDRCRVVLERKDELTSGALQFRILDRVSEDMVHTLREEELDIKRFSEMFHEVILRLPEVVGRAKMGEKQGR